MNYTARYLMFQGETHFGFGLPAFRKTTVELARVSFAGKGNDESPIKITLEGPMPFEAFNTTDEFEIVIRRVAAAS